jgi:DnaJ-class molecular chaperone
LVKERRHFDLDCWSCHVTGANLKGGPSGPYDVGPMRNVQCESCHGAGRQHVADPKVDMVRVPSEEHCKSCHSDEQTEGRFEYNSYLPRVDHVD